MNIPNLLSLSRIPLAILFFIHSIPLRSFILLAAFLTDALDGFIARTYNQRSRLGAFLDPVTDKLFVLTALTVFLIEKKMEFWQVGFFLVRDLSVLLFGSYLWFKGLLGQFEFRSIYSGKLTTFLQFFSLFLMTLGYTLTPLFYTLFIILGFAALIELYVTREEKVRY